MQWFDDQAEGKDLPPTAAVTGGGPQIQARMPGRRFTLRNKPVAYAVDASSRPIPRGRRWATLDLRLRATTARDRLQQGASAS
jgi:hypothetical protein